jgi:hypothetical protein
MKKALYTSLVVCLIFLACKKESNVKIQTQKSREIEEVKKKIPVKFTVSGFKQNFEKIASITSDSEPLKKYISNLYYMVYDAKGLEVKRIRYNSSYGNFGIIMDTLSKGVYDIVLVGVKGDVLINGDRYPDATQSKLFDGARFELLHSIDSEVKCYDTFFCRTTVNVEDEDVNSVVSLQRVVGAMEINLEDAIPENATEIVTSLTGEHYIFNFENENTSDPYVEANVINEFKESDKGKKNYKIKLFALNTNKPMLVKLSCYDKSNKLLAQKTIANVKCERNRKLVLSGKLFNDNSVTSGQVVYVDSDWGPNSKTVNF